MRARTRLVPTALAVVVVLMAGCSQADPPEPEPTDEHQVGPEASAELTVAGLADNPLVLTIEPGDLAAPGMVRSLPLDVPGPEGVPWFDPAGPVTEVAVDARQASPLTLRFAPKPQTGAVPIVWRRDAEVGWYPVAAGELGTAAVAERSRFSPHVPGWANVSRWFDDRLADIGRWAIGRTEQPRCSGGPPEWAELQDPALDVLLACAGTNRADGVERVEVQVKNNRGLMQEIAIPEGVAYADVEGQPEYVREAVRKLTGGRDVVLLPPGARLSIGFTRPNDDREVQLVPRVSSLALAADLAVRLSDLADEQGSDFLLVAVLQLQQCADADGALLRGILPQSLSDVRDFVADMAVCLASAGGGSNLAKAVSIAEQYVALRQDVPLALVQSDRAFGPLVEKWAGRINVGATLFRAVDLARMAGQIWENVGELLGREFAGAYDPAIVRLAMGAAVALTEIAPAECSADAASSALCRFVVAVLDDQLGSLSSNERAVAQEVGTLPNTEWHLGECDPIGDITLQCPVNFDGRIATFSMQPIDGEYNPLDGHYTTPPGQAVRYEVVSFDGIS